LAALRAVAKGAADKRSNYVGFAETDQTDVWAGLGLGSDVAAAMEGRGKRRS